MRPEGLGSARRTADMREVTTFSSPGRLVPVALRPVVLDDGPEGWERQVFEPSQDGDALNWLGFEPADPAEPLLSWSRPSRPSRWPAARRRATGRHRAPARLRIA
jgi:hypothetical protein